MQWASSRCAAWRKVSRARWGQGIHVAHFIIDGGMDDDDDDNGGPGMLCSAGATDGGEGIPNPMATRGRRDRTNVLTP